MTKLLSMPGTNTGIGAIQGVARQLLDYCQARDWAGYDPYDALNSRAFDVLPISRVKFCRLALTQFLKNCPINLRPVLMVPPTHNPKGIALFLAAVLKLSKLGMAGHEQWIADLLRKLETLRSPGVPYWCWGYSFAWQTRTLMAPRGAPNVVCTVFAAEALLDWFEECGDRRYLGMAASAADYILNELYWSEGASIAGISYPTPGCKTLVHNTNFLAAALLCRVACHSGNGKYLEPALKLARCSADKQQKGGAWSYGERVSPSQAWKDNFHTGFNLSALKRIGRYAPTTEFTECLSRGYQYYLQHFFRSDGAPKYFDEYVYPIDAHSAGQSLITLSDLKELHSSSLDLANQVCQWSIANLRDREGFFYFQRRRLYTNRIPYMRWSQAWMLLGLATLAEALSIERNDETPQEGCLAKAI